MSNYHADARHPETGETELAMWLDDYYGRHRYGVKFKDGKVFPAEACVDLLDIAAKIEVDNPFPQVDWSQIE